MPNDLAKWKPALTATLHAAAKAQEGELYTVSGTFWGWLWWTSRAEEPDVRILHEHTWEKYDVSHNT